MLSSYMNPRDPRRYIDKQRNERVVFEGIYMTNCANQGELMLSSVEEKLVNKKTVSGAGFKSLIDVIQTGCREDSGDLH